MRRFDRAGILTEITGQARNRRFEYREYLKIFREEDAAAHEVS